MINDVTQSSSLYQAQRAQNAYSNVAAEKSASAEARGEPKDTVEISETGKSVSRLLNEVSNFSLDPAFHLANAETQLKEIMARFGIPETEDVSIKSTGDGRYTVSGDHPLLGEVENLVNSDDPSVRDLRNSLAGAHTGATLQRIAAAAEMAMKGADANPAKTEQYYNWILTVANGAKNMDYDITLQNGELSGSLIDGEGKRIAAASGLTLPS